MKLICAGASSKGNSFALVSEKEILLLEAGVRAKVMAELLMNYDQEVVGLLASHRHFDHLKYQKDYLTRFGCQLYGNADVIATAKRGVTIRQGKTFNIGHFRITPFDVYHDVPCLGFLIHHDEMGTMFFATDTCSIPYVFPNINLWCIEANYSDSILDESLKSGKIDKFQYDRILTTHLSLDNALSEMTMSGAEHSSSIVLTHLSSRNSDPKLFKEVVEKQFSVPCYIAKKGLTINIAPV